MPSIKDIASDLGITAATVSNALSGKGRVSKDLAERIRTRADELGYRPNLAGRALRSGKTGILGLVMPDLTNPLFPRIAQTISNEADAKQLGILIADSRGSAAEQSAALRRMLNLGVDGLLVVPQKGTSPDPMPVPVVVINTESDPQNAVSADHVGGGALIARHITEIGHRRLLLLGCDPVSEVQRDRIKGMTSALPADVTARILWGEAGVAQVPDQVKNGVTAILTTSDLIALQVHSSLLRAQISVPEQVSLTGFDNMSISSIMHPTLTTVAQNVEDIASRAIEIITAMIAKTEVPNLGEVVPMRLVIRKSTAIPN